MHTIMHRFAPVKGLTAIMLSGPPTGMDMQGPTGPALPAHYGLRVQHTLKGVGGPRFWPPHLPASAMKGMLTTADSNWQLRHPCPFIYDQSGAGKQAEQYPT